MYNLIDRKDLHQTCKKRRIVIYYIQIDKHLYVGSSTYFSNRIRNHRYLLMNKKHYNKYMQNVFNKYNSASFGILQEFEEKFDRKELFQIESNWCNILKSDLNLDDPTLTGGNHFTKPVYQYDKQGNLVKRWNSINEASIELNLNRYPIYSCAGSSNLNHKSSFGFVWSYSETPVIYENKTGSNLNKTPVALYNMGVFEKEFNSLADLSRYLLVLFPNSTKNSLLGAVFNSVKKGWKIRNTYTVKYL